MKKILFFLLSLMFVVSIKAVGVTGPSNEGEKQSVVMQTHINSIDMISIEKQNFEQPSVQMQTNMHLESCLKQGDQNVNLLSISKIKEKTIPAPDINKQSVINFNTITTLNIERRCLRIFYPNNKLNFSAAYFMQKPTTNKIRAVTFNHNNFII